MHFIEASVSVQGWAAGQMDVELLCVFACFCLQQPVSIAEISPPTFCIPPSASV